MIQVMGLLLSGAAAAGIMLADSLLAILGCWALGASLGAGLSAAGRSEATAQAARQGFMVEILGAWSLALGGLGVVLAVGSGSLALHGPRLLLLDLGRHALPWAGAAVLLAVLCRLGLPPLPPWPVRVASAPPAVRLFLHAGLHPLTALVLWRRLDLWLLPWHRDAALWLGAAGALVLALAAAGERHGARRAAYLGASRWAGLLAASSFEILPGWTLWLLAAGMASIQLAVASPRWSVASRRALLVAGGLAILPAGVPTGDLAVAGRWLAASPASLLMHATTVVMLRVLWCWWNDLGRPVVLGSTSPIAGPAMPGFQRLAHAGWGDGPGRRPVAAVMGALARLTADIDRVVLDGVLEGLGWLGLGAGWLVAWIDRRVMDAVDRGLAAATRVLGRTGAASAGERPGQVLIWGLAVILVVTLLGRTLA